MYKILTFIVFLLFFDLKWERRNNYRIFLNTCNAHDYLFAIHIKISVYFTHTVIYYSVFYFFLYNVTTINHISKNLIIFNTSLGIKNKYNFGLG